MVKEKGLNFLRGKAEKDKEKKMKWNLINAYKMKIHKFGVLIEKMWNDEMMKKRM